jgi:DNA-binding GntR family transcriptional regulator
LREHDPSTWVRFQRASTHKAILTALLNRDPLAAHQSTLVQLKETSEDISEILHVGLDLH